MRVQRPRISLAWFFGTGLALTVLLVVSEIECSTLDRWRKDLVLVEAQGSQPPGEGALTQVSGGFGRLFSGLIHSVGGIIPLRGLASLAVDMGLPGAVFLLEVLTPRSSTAQMGNYRTSTGRGDPEGHGAPVGGRSTIPANVASSSGSSSLRVGPDMVGAHVAYSPFRDEIQSIVGAVHGHRDCVLKLACLTGKRLSALSGASAATIMLSTASDMMPEVMKGPFSALRNSVMYSDDCSQYLCSKYPDQT